MDTVIKYHSELSSQQKFSFNKKFYPAGDADKIKLWLRSTDLGNFVKDRSGRNHTASLYGDPTLVNGTLDLGIHTYGVKSIARRMNRPTSDFQNLEWMAVPDTADLRSAGLTVGISIFIRFRLHSLSDQNGRAPTIFEKIEDSTPNDAYMLQAKSDGRLVFIFKKGGVTYSKESATPTITAGAVYDVWAVFDETDNSIHIYLDGAELTLEPFTGGVNWQTNTTNYDLQIFRRGPDEEEGFVYGDFYDLKFYPEYVVSDLDVSTPLCKQVDNFKHSLRTGYDNKLLGYIRSRWWNNTRCMLIYPSILYPRFIYNLYWSDWSMFVQSGILQSTNLQLVYNWRRNRWNSRRRLR